MAKILIVEDDRAHAALLTKALKDHGHDILSAADGTTALSSLRRQPCDLILSDVMMKPMDGLQLVAQLRAESNRTPVILFSVNPSLELAARTRAAGIEQFLTKPIKPDDLRRSVDRALAKKSSAPPSSSEELAHWLGQYLPGTRYEATGRALSKLVAHPRALLEAEPGMVFREMLSAIHHCGPASDGPLVIHHLGKASVADATAGLLGESGAPGAWFEVSRRGTLVLLAAESLPIPVQGQLCNVLSHYHDGRLIVTTQTNPDLLVAQGRLHGKLAHELSALSVRLPPVRELGDDIPALFRHCLTTAPGYVFGAAELHLEDAVSQALRTYVWPENIAEVRQVAARVAARARSPQITLTHLPERFLKSRLPTLAAALLEAQTAHVQLARRLYGNQPAAAAALAVPVAALDSADGAPPPPLFQLSHEIVPVASPRPPSVLLVVGDPVLRAACEAAISENSFRLRTAADALGAITLVAARPADFSHAIVVGRDDLFSLAELSQHLVRLAADLRVLDCTSPVAGSAPTVADLTATLARLIPTQS